MLTGNHYLPLIDQFHHNWRYIKSFLETHELRKNNNVKGRNIILNLDINIILAKLIKKIKVT